MRPPRVCAVSPDRQLIVADSRIATQSFEAPRGQRTPIDRFFRSLAERHRDGFAIVLSGSDSGGTIGIRAVKGAGGNIRAQDPSEAEYPRRDTGKRQ